MRHRRLPCWGAMLALAAVMQGCGGSSPSGDGECQDGDSQCHSVTEIQYCFNGRWVTPESCPPEENDGFTITTICDAGLCRP